MRDIRNLSQSCAIVELDKHTHTRVLLVIVCSLTLFGGGCGTMSVPESIAQPADSYTNKVSRNGLLVAAHPVTDKQELNAAFNTNLLEKGILPILVVVENESAASSFIVPKDGVRVVDAQSRSAGLGGPPEGSSPNAGDVILAAGLIVMSPAAIIIGAKLGSDAQVIRHNISDKAFYGNTVSHGQKAHGYVYFQIPKDNPPLSKYRIIVTATDSATNERISFEFPIVEAH